MPDYDPDRNYFRELDQKSQSWTPVGKAVIQGSVPAWQCHCYHWNGIKVERCNNCGAPKPHMKVTQ